jgi:RNA polymerase sigma factor (sigma-70 family)
VADQQPVASAREVAAVEPAIRRVVAARADNPADIDDLVQECLERLLVARVRLAPGAVLPYAIVTARNLVGTHARNSVRRQRAAPRMLDTQEPDRPEDLVLAGESRRAMLTALSQLSPQERADILAYYSDDPPPAGMLESPGALRVRMARIRAKLRLEYLIAFRHVDLQSTACRGVLLAISAGDTRRQEHLRAADHLLDCETCTTLSEPLERRSIALTAITIPAGLAGWLLTTARARPVHTAGVTLGSVAVAAAAVLGPRILAHPHPHPLSSTPPAAAVRPPVVSHLDVGGRAVTDAQAQASLRPMVGEKATAAGVRVAAAPAHNGFWIGSPQGQVWVELAGPLEPLHIVAGDHVVFTGVVVGNGSSFPAKIGVTSHEGAGLLDRQGAHIVVLTTKIRIESGP